MQQRVWGKCSEPWMEQGGFCAATCGRCGTAAPSTSCGDNPPPGGHSCAQQRDWGKCSEQWMRDGGYCAATCGFGCSPSATDCTDNQPPGETESFSATVYTAPPTFLLLHSCAVVLMQFDIIITLGQCLELVLHVFSADDGNRSCRSTWRKEQRAGSGCKTREADHVTSGCPVFFYCCSIRRLTVLRQQWQNQFRPSSAVVISCRRSSRAAARQLLPSAGGGSRALKSRITHLSCFVPPPVTLCCRCVVRSVTRSSQVAASASSLLRRRQPVSSSRTEGSRGRRRRPLEVPQGLKQFYSRIKSLVHLDWLFTCSWPRWQSGCMQLSFFEPIRTANHPSFFVMVMEPVRQ